MSEFTNLIKRCAAEIDKMENQIIMQQHEIEQREVCRMKQNAKITELKRLLKDKLLNSNVNKT